MEIVYLLALALSLLAGFFLARLFFFSRAKAIAEVHAQRLAALERELAAERTSLATLRERTENLASERAGLEAQKQALERESGEVVGLRSRVTELTARIERDEAEKEALNRRVEEKEEDFRKQREALARDFENLANRIFEEKSKSFSDKSRKDLGHLLEPLKERLNTFERSVRENTNRQTESGAALKQQIIQLTELNKQMLVDAENLTKALKGDSKMRGNWGELLLAKVLERSGLNEGSEFHVQVSQTSEDGRRLQPDVVVDLPEGRKIVIDAKVSLNAYERYASADDEEARKVALKAHVQSVRNHVKELSDKKYDLLYGIGSPDFVLMFVPIEPALGAALQADDGLYTDAFDRSVVLVTPSTLLATLRTVERIWKQEYQNRHVLQIADESGKLYDKFVGFVDDLQSVGALLERTRQAHEASMKKLSSGRGNLVSRAEQIRSLGARTRKKLDEELSERALESGLVQDERKGTDASLEAHDSDGQNADRPAADQTLFDARRD